MRYIIVVATDTGICRFTCAGLDEVLETFRDVLHADAATVEATAAWVLRAGLGDWFDWPAGYVFTVCREPTVIKPEELITLGEDVEEEVTEPTAPKFRVVH